MTSFLSLKDTAKNGVTMACCYQERLFSDSDDDDDRDEDYIPPSMSESESEFTDGNEKKTRRKRASDIKKLVPSFVAFSALN